MDYLLLPAIGLVLLLGFILLTRRAPRVPESLDPEEPAVERDRRGRDIDAA